MSRRKQTTAQGSPIKLVSMLGTVFNLFFAIFFIIMPMLSNYFIVTDFSVSNLKYDIISSRIINAPECLSYEDDLGNVHAGTIDVSKLTEDVIQKCISLRAYKIVFYDDISNPHITETTNFDEFNKLITEFHGENWQDKMMSRKFLVNYFDDNDNIKTGILEVIL
jgi:hypothetical protein